MIDSTRRTRSRWSLLGPILVATTLVSLSACSVDGEATAAADLTGRAVAAADFPGGSASRVPAPAVTDALADLAGLPTGGSVLPPDCTPPKLSADGAVVLVRIDGGGGPGGSTAYTSALVHSRGSLSSVLDRGRRCPLTTAGTVPTAMSLVRTEVLAQPHSDVPGVRTGAIRRLVTTGGPGPSALTTTTVLRMAQKDGVRALVEFRHPGDRRETPSERARLNDLYGKAIRAAFGH